MKSKNWKGHSGAMLLKGGVSLVALTAFGMTLSAPVYAQTGAAGTSADKSGDDAQQVVVVGVRRSLKSAQQIKKDADTVVDSITATDIGAFPDKSVAEALQRVAGITVSRFAATGDTAHFSAEPSGVLVRGLSQVRSEFNGRDTFSANSSRGLSWGDVSPELMAGVDTYKNQTADLIEGGISGSINLRTRVPFDSKGQLIALSADYSYHDLAKKGTPDYSGIYSNRWDTSLGEFGLMVNYAYSLVKTDTQGDQLGRIKIFDSSVFNTPVTKENPNGRAYIPSSVTFHDTLYTRTRKGLAAAAQWQNHDHTMLATLQYNDSSYQNDWEERYVSASAFGTWQLPASDVSTDKRVVVPLAGTPGFTFDNRGYFQTGVQSSNIFDGTQPVGDWSTWPPGALQFGKNDQGQPFYTACHDFGWAGGGNGTYDTCPRQASGVGTGTRFASTIEKTQDSSFNFKWDPTDRLKLNFDVQYVHATVDNYDMTADTATYGIVAYDYSGKYPKIHISTPSGSPIPVTPSTAGNGDYAANPGGVANPSNYRYNDLMDHAETSQGHEIASRLDAQYSFQDGGWLDSLKVGVRYADREQKLRWSTYNWNDISSPWSNASPNNTDCYSITSSCYPKEYETLTFSPDLLGGGLISGDNNNVFAFTSLAGIEDRAGFAAAMNEAALGKRYNGDPKSFKGWTPLCNRTLADDPLWVDNHGGTTTDANGDKHAVAANVDGCYLQQELTTVSEKTQAVYVELKFGGDEKTIFGKPVSGNIGVRWVQTEDASKGYLTPPGTGWVNCDTTVPNNPAPSCLVNSSSAPNVSKAFTFSSGPRQALDADVTHINWLPSFNLKVKLTDQWIVRFAASRAMSRPDMGYFKNFVSVNAPSFDQQCQTAGACTIGPNGKDPIDYTPIFTASAGNPGIKSTTADQFDLTAEDYFAAVGSFTFDLFYKKFYDYIQFGSYNMAITSNGVTENVRVNGPINGDGASIRGFEVAYQRFFDFLPAPFDGLGVQANYTHLSNTGINNTHVSNVSGSGDLNTGGSGIDNSVESIDPHALEGLSDDSYNLIGMYEKGPWAARLAYNWRSKYLVSASDCCVGLPVWQKQAGFLDGSIRYKVSDNIELSLSGSNILGTQTVLLQQIEGDIQGKTPNAAPLLMPNAWWKNDRNFQIGIRLKY